MITPEEIRQRFGYHRARPPQEVPKGEVNTAALHATVRQAYIQMAELVLHVTRPSREQSQALTDLQTSMMWVNAEIARHAPLVDEDPEALRAGGER